MNPFNKLASKQADKIKFQIYNKFACPAYSLEIGIKVGNYLNIPTIFVVYKAKDFTSISGIV